MPYFLLAAVLVALDQASKFLVRARIPLGDVIPVVPGVIALTHVENTGAAFSSFTSGTVVLAIVSGAASVALAVLLARNRFHSRFADLCLAAILAGAVGNFIDRCFLGYVTDMFETLFVSFAVFNVADACLVLGAIGLCVHIVFFDRGGRR